MIYFFNEQLAIGAAFKLAKELGDSFAVLDLDSKYQIKLIRHITTDELNQVIYVTK